MDNDERPVRRRLKADDRRRQIVETAFDTIAEKGFEGLRTRDVAERVGINSATLHHYFPTKEALVEGIAEHLERLYANTRGDTPARERAAGANTAPATHDGEPPAPRPAEPATLHHDEPAALRGSEPATPHHGEPPAPHDGKSAAPHDDEPAAVRDGDPAAPHDGEPAAPQVESTAPRDGEPAALRKLRQEFADVAFFRREHPRTWAVSREFMLRAPRDPIVATVIARLNERWCASVERVLAEGRDAGVFRAVLDPAAAAVAVVGALWGSVVLTEPDEARFAAICDEIEAWLTTRGKNDT